MRTYIIPFIAISSIFSFSCFGQGSNSVPISELKEKVTSKLGRVPKDDRVIVSYKVEEVVNTASGQRVTTYEVSRIELVDANDLGPNNTRKVIPVYGKSKLKATEKDIEVKSTIVADVVTVNQVSIPMVVSSNAVKSANMNVEKSVSMQADGLVGVTAKKLVGANTVKSTSANADKSVAVNTTKSAKSANVNTKKAAGVTTAKSVGLNPVKSVSVNVVNTYEKVLDKGYRSIDMLRKVADKSYFDGNLSAAVKYYAELLEADAALETVCYYRYAQSLKGLGQMEKADEMMKVYESKKK
jgi:hypothetical protein